MTGFRPRSGKPERTIALQVGRAVALLCVTLWASNAYAYPSYDDVPGPVVGQGCVTCHNQFQGGNGALHKRHNVDFGITECNLCHPSGGGTTPVYTFWSGPGGGFGCAGCHGRDYGETSQTPPHSGQPKATAYGLRKYHEIEKGIASCGIAGGCHVGGALGHPNPLPTPLDENVAPPYYGQVTNNLTNPCASYEEDLSFDMDSVGLDNDGDGDADWPADGDCAEPPTPTPTLTPTPTIPVPQDSDQQKCITKINKNGSKVVKAQGKANFKCILFAGQGKLAKLGAANPDDCLTTDLKQTVQKKKGKTVQFAGKFCDDPIDGDGKDEVPDFGVPTATIAATVNGAAVDQSLALIDDVYGPDLTSVLADCGFDAASKDACQCQQKVVKDMTKLLDAKLKEFVKCKKFALKNGKLPFPNGATSAADLETCVDDAGTPGSIADDGKGKILKKADKLAKDIFLKCHGANTGPVDTANLFPGECAAEDDSGGETLAANALAQCIDERVECRACLIINEMDNLNVDCDVFDDGDGNNDSCPPGG